MTQSIHEETLCANAQRVMVAIAHQLNTFVYCRTQS